MPEFIENILIGIRQWVNGKIEELSFVISSHINELYRVKEDKKIPEPLCFTALETGVTIGLVKLSTNQTLEYSRDLTTWSAMTTATTITLANSGDSCYIRGVLSANNSINDFTQFTMSGSISASGDCNSLWDYENPDTPLKVCCGFNMFYNCTGLTTAPELPSTALAGQCYYGMFDGCTSLSEAPELPAIKLESDCYNGMFASCTSLTTAPVLPATTLANYCYYQMFFNCSGLTTSPELPATTLSNYCYEYMFSGCTGLITVPQNMLPATTLASVCYKNMFQGCTSLTTAPELPATTLAVSCYQGMFYDCTSLNYIKCLATNISAYDCLNNWVDGVASSGTFVKESTMTGWPLDDVSGIPSGWTVYNHYTDVELDKKLQQLTNLLNQ